jgi:hypothetical protein
MGIIAGILLVVISVAHNIYGEKKQLPDLKAITRDTIMIGSLRIMIFQGGLLLFAVGIIQILVSIDIIELKGVARYFPLGIVLINFLTALLISVFAHRKILRTILPQFIVFIIIIGLMSFSL